MHELSWEFCCVIDAPVDEVFAAITDKAAISTFFTDASSASLEAGRTVLWRFGDLEIDVHAPAGPTSSSASRPVSSTAST